jgi:hypothetical protein
MRTRRWLGTVVVAALAVGGTLAVTGGTAQALPSECAQLNRQVEDDIANYRTNLVLSEFYGNLGYTDLSGYYSALANFWHDEFVDDNELRRQTCL